MILLIEWEDMDYYKMFDDFMKNCGYDFSEYRDNNSSENEESPPPGVADDDCRCGDSDIPGGFQDLNPQELIVIATIIGINLANKLPFNMQNTIGNLFELLGQVIITFNAQQQYFQGGPGRYYNPIYRNSSNPFCESTVDESGANTAGTSSKSSGKNSSKSSSNGGNKELKKRIEALEKEIAKLKKDIDNNK